MSVINKKKLPVTTGSRNQRILNKSELAKNSLIIKDKTVLIRYRKGRSSSTGNITSRHKGGGHKKRYLCLDYSFFSRVSICLLNLYNPNSSNFRSLRFDLNSKVFFYTLSTNTIYPGSISTYNSPQLEYNTGSRLMLKFIPPGSFVHDVSFDSNEPRYVKSAGTFAILIKTINGISFLKLPSRKIIKISETGVATLGVSNNINSFNVRLGKAGQNRNVGKRPSVRGIAMNPVDHPHGGRTNGGRPSVSPWGLPTKSGFKLRKKKYE